VLLLGLLAVVTLRIYSEDSTTGDPRLTARSPGSEAGSMPSSTHAASRTTRGTLVPHIPLPTIPLSIIPLSNIPLPTIPLSIIPLSIEPLTSEINPTHVIPAKRIRVEMPPNTKKLPTGMLPGLTCSKMRWVHD
jgi:hypothetical protein